MFICIGCLTSCYCPSGDIKPCLLSHSNLGIYSLHIVQIYSGITSGRVFDGELLSTKILEVNLLSFAYRLLSWRFLSNRGGSLRLKRNRHETVCRQMQTNQLLESLCICTLFKFFKLPTLSKVFSFSKWPGFFGAVAKGECLTEETVQCVHSWLIDMTTIMSMFS